VNTVIGRRVKNPRPTPPNHDIRSSLQPTDPCTIISSLSPDLERLLGNKGNLAEAVVDLIDDGEVLYEGVCASSVMVLRLDQQIVVKVTHKDHAQTEYRTLSYLEEHFPSFPAPRLHGVIQMRQSYLLFTTFVPGLDLEKAWPQLDDAQKHSISDQLDTLLSELRSLPFPPNTPLGAVDGQGCKDARRGIRVSSETIMDVRQFQDFIFAGSRTASRVYRQFLRDLMPTSTKIVFTHGDLRPANIMVRMGEDGGWAVAAIIDWDMSGFYPEYWESVKMTNNLAPIDRWDWYKFLPESLSQRRYPVQWLVDRVWDYSLDNR
jgi:hypothetical protein